ncbi:SMI1/KNR4 family protein [Streptomyces sp. Act143]|uniref:SMI1/KNR4 family protein n=1 Tax=Streptomyces sp. Act143 TaxID=2200760 RepID=UPI000D673E60|nr:SMI1/KNR4 family protein [Streptomyces sp. Act143]PWI14473.1 SMI1/KNR4 family protein [Streptomyces sp. Act143]
MEMRMFIGELMRVRTREYLATSPLEPDHMPGLRPPADSAQLEALEILAGQPLDRDYRKFLTLTDGMDGFQSTMPLLGCRDWNDSPRSELAFMFRDTVLETGPLAEYGLPEEAHVFPVFVDSDGASGVLMVHAHDEAAERFWWSSEGDDMFFRTFGDLISYVTDSTSCTPRRLFG